MEIIVKLTEFECLSEFLTEMYAIVEYLEVKPVKSELDKRMINSFRELVKHIDTDDIKKNSKLRLL